MPRKRPLLCSLALIGLGSLLGCNIQPANPEAPPAPVKATPAPPPAQAAEVAKPVAEAPAPVAAPTRPEAPPSGPQAEAAAPLPPTDAVIALYHTGNVEGSTEPCG